MELQRERHKFGHAQTVQELQSMIATLEREAENNRRSASKRQSLAAEVDATRAELRTSVTKLEVKSSINLIIYYTCSSAQKEYPPGIGKHEIL